MIALAQPQTTQIASLLVVSIDIRFGVDDTFTLPTLSYVACDAQGNPVPGQGVTLVRLGAPDVLAFFTTPGSLRVRAQAALQSNLGQTGAGTAT
jgi:hypothetical protein